MPTIGRVHALLAKHAPSFCVGILAGGRVQEQIEEAIHETQDSEAVRESPLHPVLVFWLTLCLPLFRSLSIPNVFSTLIRPWRERMRGVPLRPVTDGALAHARARLGFQPLRHLFEALGADVRPQATFHGRRVWALDGVHATAPDTPANEAAFGRPGSGRGRSAFPQVSIVTLSSAQTHELRGAAVGRVTAAERPAALELLPLLGPDDLVIQDRGFFALWFLDRIVARECDFLVRVPSDVKALRRTRRGEGDYDVVLQSTHLPPALRLQGGERPQYVLRARMIQYTLDGKETIRLLTTLCDRGVTPLELVRLYHDRWEAELGYDEIKTHLATVTHGTLHTVFRGRTPAMVEQELWATLALYNLVRRLIARAAELHKLDPRRISFTDALLVIRQTAPVVDRSDLRSLAPLYVRLMADLGDCRLDRWRRPRRVARAVKVKMSNYALKRPADRCVRVDFLAGLRFLETAA